jgi:hypothetical protein
MNGAGGQLVRGSCGDRGRCRPQVGPWMPREKVADVRRSGFVAPFVPSRPRGRRISTSRAPVQATRRPNTNLSPASCADEDYAAVARVHTANKGLSQGLRFLHERSDSIGGAVSGQGLGTSVRRTRPWSTGRSDYTAGSVRGVRPRRAWLWAARAAGRYGFPAAIEPELPRMGRRNSRPRRPPGRRSSHPRRADG